MDRRYVSELKEREHIDQVFLVNEKQLRTNRSGNFYLQLRLADKTGAIVGMLWNANESLVQSFEGGDYLRVQATTQNYNGSLQLILNHIQRVSAEEVDAAEFVTLTSADTERLACRLSELLRGMNDVNLRNLAECFLTDEKFMAKFMTAPAGIRNHHAYAGGLIEHVVGLMELATLIADRYPQIDQDQLVMGAFVHDIGKIEELVYEREMGYSDEGQLIGHLVMGVAMVERKIEEAERLAGEPFPKDLALKIKHMVVSHHGSYEFGSPKLPMTLEAIALHYLDNLDSKIHNVTQLIKEDANSEDRWTSYQPSLERKFYKLDVR